MKVCLFWLHAEQELVLCEPIWTNNIFRFFSYQKKVSIPKEYFGVRVFSNFLVPLGKKFLKTFPAKFPTNFLPSICCQISSCNAKTEAQWPLK